MACRPGYIYSISQHDECVQPFKKIHWKRAFCKNNKFKRVMKVLKILVNLSNCKELKYCNELKVTKVGTKRKNKLNFMYL